MRKRFWLPTGMLLIGASLLFFHRQLESSDPSLIPPQLETAAAGSLIKAVTPRQVELAGAPQTSSEKAEANNIDWSDEQLQQEATRLAHESPASGFKSSQRLRTPDQRSQFLLYFGLALAPADSLLIKDWIFEMPPDGAQQRLMERLSEGWTESDPKAALGWALALSVPERRTASVAEIVRSWALLNPADALQAVFTSVPPDLRESSVEIILDRWAQKDAMAVFTHLGNWPLNPETRPQLEMMFRFQSHREAPALGTWLNDQPAGALRDLGVQSLVSGISTMDPAGARTWALTIEEKTLREEVMKVLPAN